MSDLLVSLLSAGLLARPAIDYAQVELVLQKLAAVAPGWVYLTLAVGVAIENFFPPMPADTFVVLGAFLAVYGEVTELGVFSVTWATNTAAALLVYAVARRWGRAVLATPAGQWLLRPRQLERLAALYNGHGSKIIFVSRFLPAFRVLVPVFAGVSQLAFWRTALPVALASGVWYGVLVYVGALFGRNWRVILDALANLNTVLAVVAGLLAVALATVWWRTRHQAREWEEAEGG